MAEAEYDMIENEAEMYEDEELEDGAHEPGPSTERKRLFTRELRTLLYGLGDDKEPYKESVDLLSDLVFDYIVEMTNKALEIGRVGRVQVEDIIFLVRKDPKKYARVKELLTMNEELKKARKAFDECKYTGLDGKSKKSKKSRKFDT